MHAGFSEIACLTLPRFAIFAEIFKGIKTLSEMRSIRANPLINFYFRKCRIFLVAPLCGGLQLGRPKFRPRFAFYHSPQQPTQCVAKPAARLTIRCSHPISISGLSPGLPLGTLGTVGTARISATFNRPESRPLSRDRSGRLCRGYAPSSCWPSSRHPAADRVQLRHQVAHPSR